MTAPAAQHEVDQVATAYQVAVSKIGAQTAAEALALWQDMPPQPKPTQVRAWLNAVKLLITRRRNQTRALARSYYRLSRALITGATIADPSINEGQHIALNDLRREFASQLGPQSAYKAPPAPAQGEGSTSSSSPASVATGELSVDDEDDRILVEEIARLKAEEDAIEKAAQQEIETALAALGPANLEKLQRGIDDTLPAKDVDKLRQEAHDQAGARQAAAAARISMNGARSTTWNLQENDKRAIGWARISTTGTPCGWCAMLISRGAVYRSERSASFDYEDGDKYHDNCHCIAVPVFSKEQFNSSPKFALNRQYAELWPQVTKGLGGKDALSAWRRFIRTQQRGRSAA